MIIRGGEEQRAGRETYAGESSMVGSGGGGESGDGVKRGVCGRDDEGANMRAGRESRSEALEFGRVPCKLPATGGWRGDLVVLGWLAVVTDIPAVKAADMFSGVRL